MMSHPDFIDIAMGRKLRLSVHRKNEYRKKRAEKRKHATLSLPVSVLLNSITLTSHHPRTLPPSDSSYNSEIATTQQSSSSAETSQLICSVPIVSANYSSINAIPTDVVTCNSEVAAAQQRNSSAENLLVSNTVSVSNTVPPNNSANVIHQSDNIDVVSCNSEVVAAQQRNSSAEISNTVPVSNTVPPNSSTNVIHQSNNIDVVSCHRNSEVVTTQQSAELLPDNYSSNTMPANDTSTAIPPDHSNSTSINVMVVPDHTYCLTHHIRSEMISPTHSSDILPVYVPISHNEDSNPQITNERDQITSSNENLVTFNITDDKEPLSSIDELKERLALSRSTPEGTL